MNVGELKAFLADLPDSLEITIPMPACDGWEAPDERPHVWAASVYRAKAIESGMNHRSHEIHLLGSDRAMRSNSPDVVVIQ